MTELQPRVSYRVVDLLITCLSFVLGYVLADHLTGDYIFFSSFEIRFGGLRSFQDYWLILFVIPFIWWVVLDRASLYDPLAIRNSGLLFKALLKAHLGGGLVLFGLFYMAKFYFPSRLQMLLFLAFNIAFLYIWKRLVIYVWQSKKPEAAFQRLLLIGSNVEARRFARQLIRFPELGYRIVGYLSNEAEAMEESDDLPQRLGLLSQIEEVARATPVDEVIIFSYQEIGRSMDLVATVCEDMGIRLTIVPQWPILKVHTVDFRKLAGIPLVSFVFDPQKSWSIFFKRIIDFGLSLMIISLFFPFFMIIALLIKWDSKGPVFFIQERCGLNGRLFSLIKFRSMVQDAEKMQEALKGLNEMSGPVFKMTDDPRVTRFGAWLRKTSLDEFPQFLNVLKGDLSLVGPRPPLPDEVTHYKRWQRRRLSVKPGITCIWQISGRNNINFDEWINLDLTYIDHWSLSMDLKILIRTIPAVLSGRGAR